MSAGLKELKEILEKSIKNASNVFIVGHNEPDFDAVGSAIGLQEYVNSFDKNAYIVIGEQDIALEAGVKKIVDENREKFNFITLEEFEKLKDKDSLLITTDVNKKYLVAVEKYLDDFKDIIIIDHHEQDENTIKTSKIYINLKASSSSEIVAQLLNSLKIKYSKRTASYLLAGIVLDTKRFKQNTSSKTHDVAEKLLDRGADADYVNGLFLEDFETYCRISNLIINGTIIKQYSTAITQPNVSFTLNREKPTKIYNSIELAKAADRMLKFRAIDASFALGFIDEGLVSISARSGKNVDVGQIMSEMDGLCGGNSQSAGGKIKTDDILQVEEKLMKIVENTLNESQTIDENQKKIIKLFS